MSSSFHITADVQRPPLSQPGQKNFIVASRVPIQNESPLHKNVNAMYAMGMMGIGLGSISIILGIVAVTNVSNLLRNANPSSTDPHALSLVGPSLQGLWCGIMVLITSIMGITLERHATRCVHIANMLFSTVCSFVALAALIMAIPVTSHLILLPTVGMHAALLVINFVTLIFTIVHACFCCTDACYKRTSEGHRSMTYLPQHNVDDVQTNPDAINQFGEELRDTLPYAEFVPRNPTVNNKPSNDELQPTTNEEPTNVTGVLLNSRYTGYEAPNLIFICVEDTITPYAAYTCYEQRNQTEREPGHADRNPSAVHEKTSTTPSLVLPVTDNDVVLNDDVDYAEPH